SASEQSGQLNCGRTGHDHNAITQNFATGFIEKWNVSQEKIRREMRGLRFGAPLTANARMENLFESAFLCRALQHYGAKSRPIQVTVRRINVRAEFFPDLLSHLGIGVGELPRRMIRIEELCAWQQSAQALAKRCLAGR